MEEINKILQFIGGAGTVTGTSYGHSDGDGTGYGTGYGHGCGDGSGTADGKGDGSGYGLGTGAGYGLGAGDGSADGTGDGSGYGDGIKIKKIGKDLVFYIDKIPTIIDKIRGNVGKGRIVNEDDFSTINCYIAKRGSYFAHENTLKKAVESVGNKIYADLAVKEIKAEDLAIEQIQKAWDMFSEEYFANEKMETLGTRFLARLNQRIQELRDGK